MTDAAAEVVVGGADIDSTGRYRYRLWREWPVLGGKGTVCFVMLNPSTADATANDPTIRRCIRFAQDWGYARLEVGNLFNWRATSPRQLVDVSNPVGEFSAARLLVILRASDVVVAAWGQAPSRLTWRVAQVEELVTVVERRVLMALAVGKNGTPKHPLYLPSALRPQPLHVLRLGRA